MVSLVTSFKKFKPPYDIIQKSAIYSWRTLSAFVPDSEIDTAKVCSAYPNIQVLSGVKRATDMGMNIQVPVFRDLVSRVLPLVHTTMVAVVSSDIILPEDFLNKCIGAFDKYGYDVIIAGSRHNVKLDSMLQDEASYRKLLDEKRQIKDIRGSDIFITSKFIWRKILSEIPDFLFGRPYLNDWLYNFAEKHKVKKYNCTNTIVTMHPIHSDDYVRYSEKAAGEGSPTTKHNKQMMWDSGLTLAPRSIKDWPTL